MKESWAPLGEPCTDRSGTHLSMILAMPGMCSQIWMPGTLVSIGWNSPRNLRRGIHFQIVHILMGRRADHVDHDHGFMPLRPVRGLFRTKESRQSQTAQPQSPDSEHIPPINAIAQSMA